VHLPDDQLFTDNAHVGRFVNDIVASMACNTNHSAVAAGSADLQQSSTDSKQCSADTSVQHDCNSAQQQKQQQQQQYTQLSQDDYGMSALYLTQDTESTNTQTDDCVTAVNEHTQCTTISQQCSTSDNDVISKHLPHSKDSSSRNGILWVNTDDTGTQQKACFVDVSVYSRNRCFRFVLSYNVCNVHVYVMFQWSVHVCEHVYTVECSNSVH
jgi:hypothetical protein